MPCSSRGGRVVPARASAPHGTGRTARRAARPSPTRRPGCRARRARCRASPTAARGLDPVRAGRERLHDAHRRAAPGSGVEHVRRPLRGTTNAASCEPVRQARAPPRRRGAAARSAGERVVLDGGDHRRRSRYLRGAQRVTPRCAGVRERDGPRRPGRRPRAAGRHRHARDGAPTRRMLVIVNPYATTMSVRLKHLVVYALQGRFDGRGRRHAAQGARDRAVPRGRARGLRRRRRVRRRRDRQRGRERARRLGHGRSPACPAARPTSTAACSASRPTWSTRPSTCSGSPTTGSRAPSTSRRVNDRWFTFAAGAGLDATVVERVDSHPRLKARFGPWYYAQAAIATFLEKLRASTRRA